VVVGLGANLGSREATIASAIGLLGTRAEIVARSRLYVTPPLGPPQPEFLNAAVRVRTALDPRELLAHAQWVEAQLGRVRRERWGPRTIDLDLLWWEGGELDVPGLTLPHAGLADRAFALAPLLDVAPELAPRYAGRLAELGAPPVRPWTDVERTEGQVRAVAFDDADALALALGAALGGAPEPESVMAFEAASPAELVRAVTLHAGGRAATVVVEALEPAGSVRARLVLDRARSAARSELSLAALEGGFCILRSRA
jgi:2-amino-4-hydroxy-6-hydroxymethyldihydropteridine diphosphokinase